MIRKIAGVLVAGAALYALASAAGRRKKHWAVYHGKDGYSLMLDEVPAWAALAEDALDGFPCTCHLPGWVWRDLPAVGSFGLALCNWRGGFTFRHGRHISRMSISRDQAITLTPEWVRECDEMFGKLAGRE